MMMRRSRTSFRAVAVAIGALAAIVGGPGALAPAPAYAIGELILVTTPSDLEFPPDGGCSLRAAIKASNIGAGGWCLEGTLDVDGIRFASNISVISVATALPAITQTVHINGLGRVRLAGPGGGFTGLQVTSSAAGSSIRGLRIDGFANGIHLMEATTVVGNVIGPNAHDGIWVQYGAAVIGGTNSFSPSPCSGDCNVISGNGDAGIEIHSGDPGVVSGNFIGVAPDGVSAMPNKNGVQLNNDAWTIGGTTAGTRNVISGNTQNGIWLLDCGGDVNCRVLGNYIGTTAAGNAPLPNQKSGILYDAPGATIGGTEPGAGNVISGNGEHGIHVRGNPGTRAVVVQGNKIGTSPAGKPMGNGRSGILIEPGRRDPPLTAIIGSATIANARNVVAYNGRHGVETSSRQGRIAAVEVRGNSIFENGLQPFLVYGGVNFPRVPPSAQGFWPLRGTTCAHCQVDVYSDAGTEGRYYEGSATADAAGAWLFTGSLRGPNVTVTETDGEHRTSEYSAAMPVPPQPKKPDGRIKKGSGALAGNNVYNLTGDNQQRIASAARGKTVTFTISIQNDATLDRFRVLGQAGNSQYQVRYFRNSTNITAAVVAGTYQTAQLAKNKTFAIQVKVKVLNPATAGSSITRLVTITSVADPTRKDVVRFIVKRK